MRKRLLVFCLFLVIYCYSYSQSIFEHLFDFNRPDNEFPLELKLFDYNSDGFDEIIIGFSLDSSWEFCIYDHNGNQIVDHQIQLNDNEELLNFEIYSNINPYLIVTLKSGLQEMKLINYELPTFNIDDQSVYSIGDLIYAPFLDSFEIDNLTVISENNIVYLNLGIQTISWTGGGGISNIFTEDFLSIFEISDQINFLSTITECIYVNPNSKIAYGNYKYTIESSTGTSTSFHAWLKQIVYSINPSANDIWENDGVIDLVTSEDNTFQTYGTVFTFRIHNERNYYCLDPDFNSILWETTSFNILGNQCNSNFIINDNDNYVIHSHNNKIEILNRIDGSCVHFEEIDFYPKKIYKSIDNQMIFVEYNQGDSYGSVYKLENINFVSVHNNEISSTLNSLMNYPNPFNPSTTIEFAIQNDSNVELSIFNTKGQNIKTLIQNELTKGQHSILWKGDDEFGKQVSSGIYYYKLYVNGKNEAVKKCLLLK